MAAWSGYWDGEFAEAYSLPTRRALWTQRLRRAFQGIAGQEGERLMYVLTGAVAGTSASYSFKHPTAVGELVQGGVRSLDTAYVINRVSAAADVTAIKDHILGEPVATFPTNLAANTRYGILGRGY